MYEELIFKLGIWTGYFLTILAIFLTYAIALNWENERKYKYLVEVKGLQGYAEWKKKNGWKIIKVKSK